MGGRQTNIIIMQQNPLVEDSNSRLAAGEHHVPKAGLTRICNLERLCCFHKGSGRISYMQLCRNKRMQGQNRFKARGRPR